MVLEIWNQLTKEIKKHDTIIIMGHQILDFDALGSSLCLYEIVKSFHKKVYIFLDMSIDKMDVSIQKAFSRIENLNISFLYPETYKENIEKNTLLVVLDTHRIDRLACPALLDEIKDVAVIDHHIKGIGHIKDTVFSYMNSGLSSITEFMIHYTKYLNKEITPIICSIMLAGIAIDTNEYRMKTTETTFEASALLMQMGAKTIDKLDFMRESKEEYIKRLDFVRKSEMINEHTMLCVMDTGIVTSRDLAIVSESLLQFDHVDVAFTIGKIQEDTIGISARSIDTIDVEEMMKKLGGGGHRTEAACQLEESNLEDAKQKLIEIIR